MRSCSAPDVAAELRRQLPGLGKKKLHKLLYYCQGHHLAHFGEPLFVEPILAYDMGPVVANLWYAEDRGVPAAAKPLDLAALNTVGYVVSRYGKLTGADLERLSHAESPWQEANNQRPPGGSVRIESDSIRAFFEADGAPEDDLPWPDEAALATLAVGAEARRRLLDPNKAPDTLEQLLARLG